MKLSPKKNTFSGEAFLLTDAANSSATFYMARFFKMSGIAKIVGQTTGGSQKGINGGNYLFLTLPNSKVEIDIPVTGNFNDDAPDEGISPDIFIHPNADDIAKGIDSELAFMINYLK